MKLLTFFFFLFLPLFADVTVVVTNNTTETRQIQVRNSDRHVVGTITVSGNGGSDSKTWSVEALEGGVVQLWVGDYLESQVKIPALQGRAQLIIRVSNADNLSIE